MELIDWSVRALSLLLGIAVVWQLFSRRRDDLSTHQRVGTITTAMATALLVLTLYRAYASYGEPHGRLYVAHLVLGVAFFVSMAVSAATGFMMSLIPSDEEQPFYVMTRGAHRVAAYAVHASLWTSLAAGIVSRVIG